MIKAGAGSASIAHSAVKTKYAASLLITGDEEGVAING